MAVPYLFEYKEEEQHAENSGEKQSVQHSEVKQRVQRLEEWQWLQLWEEWEWRLRWEKMRGVEDWMTEEYWQLEPDPRRYIICPLKNDESLRRRLVIQVNGFYKCNSAGKGTLVFLLHKNAYNSEALTL